MKSYCKRAWAEINLDRLESNIRKIRSTLKGNTEIMAVIKADAYGHGEGEICCKLSNIGVQYFAVSNLDEALSVRKHCPDSDILILGYTPAEYADVLAENNIIQGVVSTEHAQALSNNLKEGKVRCHIKIDTGMGRVGLKYHEPKQCADEVQKIIALNGLDVEGLYTHFAVADSDKQDDIDYTNSQSDFILAVYDTLAECGTKLKHVHFLNSAGACYHNNERSTLARIGIIMYGLYPNAELELPYKLDHVMELKAIISQIKTIHNGDFVSYGKTFCADKDVKVATVTVGYADGYSRQLSSIGEALVHGVRCKIVGRICMDQMLLDVSALDNVSVDDVVTLIGSDGSETITADELANIYGTIGYEVVCGISKRVPRIYVHDTDTSVFHKNTVL